MKRQERKPKYAMRKLSVGLVSCMLGFALIASPSHSLAAGGEDGEEVATEVEEELEDTPTELENDEPVDNNDGLELDVSEEKEFDNVTEPEKETDEYSISWKLYPDTKNLYDESLEGTSFNAKYNLVYSVIDKNGKHLQIVDDQVIENTLTVGTPQKFDVDLKEVDKRLKEKHPEIDHVVELSDLFLHVYGNNGNYYWGNGSGGKGLTDNNFVFSQNLNTKITYKKKEDAIILDKDKDNLNLIYFVRGNKTAEPEKEDYIKGKDGSYVYGLDKFDEGETRYLSKTTKDLERHIDGNNLELFSGYTGKYKEYKLIINNRGINDEGDRRLEHQKYYTFDIVGDDLNGWTVTLGSNLQEEEITKDIKSNYGIEYVEDPNLYEGEEVVVRDGQNGLVRDTLNHIYLIGKDGKKETVKLDKIKSDKISDIINKIVRIGTKKRTPDTPIIPDNPDTEIPDDKGDLTPEERDELDKLIQDLLDEINKEEETPDTKPEDTNKPTENEEVKPSENEEETKKPEKEDKKEEGKKETIAPVKTKEVKQKASKDSSPKTGVTGSAGIIALLGSSLLASFGFRKKNE